MTLEDLLVKIGFKTDTKPLEGIQHQLEGIHHKLEFLAATEIVKGIFELGERFAGFAEHMEQSAYTAGLTTEALQKLGYAASQSGVQAEDVTGAMAKLTRNLYAAREGGKEAQEAFAKAGFSPEQVAGFHNSTDAMKALADRMQGMSDPIAKQAMAMALLGRGASNMVMFLSKGGKSIDEMGDRAERLGAVVSGKDISALAEFEDSLSTLGQVFKSIGATIAGAFAPAMKRAIDDILEFWAANRKLFMISARKWVYDFTFALGYLVGIVQTVGQAIIQFATEHHELVKTILKVIAGISLLSGVFRIFGLVLGPFAPLFKAFGWGLSLLKKPLLSLGAAIFKRVAPAFAALAASMAANPLTWIIAGMATLLVIAHDLYAVFFQGKSFKDTWIGQAFEMAKTAGAGLMSLFGLGEDKKGKDQVGTVEDELSNEDFLASQGINPAFGTISKTAVRAGTNMDDMMGRRDAGANKASLGAAGTGSTTIDYSMNAPITVNVPAGTDPKRAESAVRSGIKDHLDRVMRDAQLGLREAKVY